MPDATNLALRRCAIYTRKSTNHLLDQDMNSLVTQREICSAYVASQRYRGWVEVDQRYDDGGQSGSGLDRPALARLMRDIEEGCVDVVVVYKIDRLTRSLIDFVRLVDIFDRRGIALVSISQAFDTSDSMGRMILNILLTFSQFERELIAERVRDSVRTRKRHGMIHGGLPPFGYDYEDGGLRIVEEEAEIVRFIFAEFLRTRRYTSVMTAVRKAGLRSSIKQTRQGGTRGGTLINGGTVHGILRNPIYVGEIRGHGRTWPGRHRPIISAETWEAARALSAERAKRPPHGKETAHFLAGLLWDDLGRHMLLDVDWHRGKPYYCYASSNATWSQREYRRAYRSNADRLEQLVIASVSGFLCDRRRLRQALKTLGLYGQELDLLATKGARAAAHIECSPASKMESLFAALTDRIEIGEEHLTIGFRSIELQRFLEWDGNGSFHARPGDWPCSSARYELEIAACAISAERWPVINVTPRDPALQALPDRRLNALLRKARDAQRMLESGRDETLDQLARQLGCRPGHFSRLVRLNYLAPDIVAAIIDGTQPASLDSTTLLKANLPLDWGLQRRLLGFAAPRRELAQRMLFDRGMWPGRAENSGQIETPST
ncbi:MAG: hypothetical protein BGO57_12665 [Sphingomonadales bacterium 63-6]|nr:MAG: hypothetical protein BGO57_12665 [Sphingomonadales bacterium 63-6]